MVKDDIKENMEVIGFDGDHLGTVDCVEADRIKLKKHDGGSHEKHHHYIGLDLVNNIEGHKVRLCCDADIARLFED
ncbi:MULTISPECIES: DUF2171 domain-containing protein [Bradyrhizobium]|jgi:hypothetical protein|uniref:DUF2171 domain-containing protein n=1 Tax=Bradyrhizobium TaxID=374 RepID=UPI00047FEC8C|nr:MULTISPECIES: DUF2171 domain-containing protein [Bradyrhizobium]MCS3450211.1 hypothetical protein [Bradyrhizobium elkanii]MCS3558644.1 hypothetical protein [Bradyrhizobium elkanii]MCW2151509.1 hypothetical protein [Bradyrhizobium elkanii]MCW2358618.1 hypothetical protein [Bradyrhizobium elkanii]MCW2375240.1 hypothetical protein [Bradyrhizobium elkanii]